MEWVFDQSPNAAAISVRTVVGNDQGKNEPVLVVTHYADDHGWAFLDGREWSEEDAMVVSMKNVIEAHPYLREVADLPPGWTATRPSGDAPWVWREDREA